MPPFPVEALDTNATYWRAGNLLSYLTNLYVLGVKGQPVNHIPTGLAVPFYEVATHLGIPPILSYALQAMVNWRRTDPAGPIAVGNLTLLQNFLGGMDEEWFVTLHINIEAVAGRALSVLLLAQSAVVDQERESLMTYLETIGKTLQTMADLLERMPERCDPDIYYHRVRPFMFSWKDNPDIPDGMIFEGVEAYRNRPVELRGETGAQSGVIPALDVALGISHELDEMRRFLMELRDYIPPDDRAFVEQLEQGPSIRCYVIEQRHTTPNLRDVYNFAIEKLTQFRTLHISYAARYILKPAQKTEAVGTGGTPFAFYLTKHKKETEAHLF